MLLQPKPKQFSRGETVKLADVTGRDRFSPRLGLIRKLSLLITQARSQLFLVVTWQDWRNCCRPRLVWSRAFRLERSKWSSSCM